MFLAEHAENADNAEIQREEGALDGVRRTREGSEVLKNGAAQVKI